MFSLPQPKRMEMRMQEFFSGPFLTIESSASNHYFISSNPRRISSHGKEGAQNMTTRSMRLPFYLHVCDRLLVNRHVIGLLEIFLSVYCVPAFA